MSGFCSVRKALVADAAECCVELFLAGGEASCWVVISPLVPAKST